MLIGKQLHFIALAATCFSIDASAAEPVDGIWTTSGGNARVQIGYLCDGILCGKILKVLKEKDGQATEDINNPDTKKRSSTINGTTILTNFVDAGSYWKVDAYDPRFGWTVKARLQPNANGTLTLRGCIFIFCGGETWHRTK